MTNLGDLILCTTILLCTTIFLGLIGGATISTDGKTRWHDRVLIIALGILVALWFTFIIKSLPWIR
jgi:hypothetical protein